jgi:hypothetical protein
MEVHLHLWSTVITARPHYPSFAGAYGNPCVFGSRDLDDSIGFGSCLAAAAESLRCGAHWRP